MMKTALLVLVLSAGSLIAATPKPGKYTGTVTVVTSVADLDLTSKAVVLVNARLDAAGNLSILGAPGQSIFLGRDMMSPIQFIQVSVNASTNTVSMPGLELEVPATLKQSSVRFALTPPTVLGAEPPVGGTTTFSFILIRTGD
jgi:hypothetical protein